MWSKRTCPIPPLSSFSQIGPPPLLFYRGLWTDGFRFIVDTPGRPARRRKPLYRRKTDGTAVLRSGRDVQLIPHGLNPLPRTVRPKPNESYGAAPGTIVQIWRPRPSGPTGSISPTRSSLLTGVRTELVRVTQCVRSDPAKANGRIRPKTHRLQPILQLGSIYVTVRYMLVLAFMF